MMEMFLVMALLLVAGEAKRLVVLLATAAMLVPLVKEETVFTIRLLVGHQVVAVATMAVALLFILLPVVVPVISVMPA